MTDLAPTKPFKACFPFVSSHARTALVSDYVSSYSYLSSDLSSAQPTWGKTIQFKVDAVATTLLHPRKTRGRNGRRRRWRRKNYQNNDCSTLSTPGRRQISFFLGKFSKCVFAGDAKERLAEGFLATLPPCKVVNNKTIFRA